MTNNQNDDFVDFDEQKDEEVTPVNKLSIQVKKDNESWLKKAEILSEALPYMRKFVGEVFIIKLGGSVIDNNYLKNIVKNIVILKQVGINPIIVHGGSIQITRMLNKLKIKSSFIDNLRVTDLDTIDIIEMILTGSINKNIVKEINLAGGVAVGLSGKDGNLIGAKKLTKVKKDPASNIEQILNLGFVGEPYKINSEMLGIFEDSDIIPVIAPIGIGDNGETFNMNANDVALTIASVLNAAKLIILSDIDGVALKEGQLLSQLNSETAKSLIKDGLIQENVISKITICLTALENNVSATHILNGLIENSLLMEIFTEKGSGTMII
jgi:acetylglutamate kinase